MAARGTALVMAVVLGSGAAWADVRLGVSSDGRKTIYNVRDRNGRADTGELEWLAKQRDRRSEWDPVIEMYCADKNVDPVLVRAIIQIESNFNPRSVSNKGAQGLMQLIPGTAKRFGVRDVFDPEQNIRGGIAYLSFLHGMFGNDLARVLAAYNAGENAVVRHGGIPPYAETKEYVKRGLTVYHGRPWGGTVKLTAGTPGRKLRGGFKEEASPAPSQLAATSSSLADAAARARTTRSR